MNKRIFLKSWSLPAIATLSMPAHAQTSCSMAETSGTWSIDRIYPLNSTLTEFTSPPAPLYTLREDGTVPSVDKPKNNLDGTWSIGPDNRISIILPGENTIYTGILNSSCDFFEAEGEISDDGIIKARRITL